MVAHNSKLQSIQWSLLTSVDTGHTCGAHTYMQAKHSYTRNKIKLKTKQTPNLKMSSGVCISKDARNHFLKVKPNTISLWLTSYMLPKGYTQYSQPSSWARSYLLQLGAGIFPRSPSFPPMRNYRQYLHICHVSLCKIHTCPSTKNFFFTLSPKHPRSIRTPADTHTRTHHRHRYKSPVVIMLGELPVIRSHHDLEMPGEEKETKGDQTKEEREEGAQMGKVEMQCLIFNSYACGP